MADSLPLTRNAVSAELEIKIRSAVRAAKHLPGDGHPASLATSNDVAGLFAFWSDPAVHTAIYSIPRPLTLDSVSNYIETSRLAQTRGERLLFVRRDESNAVVGYSDFQIWPEWAAGELGGAIAPHLQSKGAGSKGAEDSFNWMFKTLFLQLIVNTASKDNIRAHRLLDGLGFHRRGQIISQSSDGTTRPSLVWELDRNSWSENYRSG